MYDDTPSYGMIVAKASCHDGEEVYEGLRKGWVQLKPISWQPGETYLWVWQGKPSVILSSKPQVLVYWWDIETNGCGNKVRQGGGHGSVTN